MEYVSLTEMCLNKLHAFFDGTENFITMHTIITRNKATAGMSLRTIEWFVKNYAKKNKVSYELTINGEVTLFDVYNGYILELSSRGNVGFDVYCRVSNQSRPSSNSHGTGVNRVVSFTYMSETGEQCALTSTIGQLMFFKWLFEHKVLDYLNEHIAEIEQDMRANKKRPHGQTVSCQRTRRELSVGAKIGRAHV